MIEPTLAEKCWAKICEAFPELIAYDAGVGEKIINDLFAENTVKRSPQARVKIPPPMEELAAYVKEIGAGFEAEAFFDFYAQRGWRVGRTPMKDWKAACRQWKREGWGLHDQLRKSVPGSPAKVGLTEWERSQKEERMANLRRLIEDIRRPGGAAYAVALSGEKLERAQRLQAEVETIKKELGRSPV